LAIKQHLYKNKSALVHPTWILVSQAGNIKIFIPSRIGTGSRQWGFGWYQHRGACLDTCPIEARQLER